MSVYVQGSSHAAIDKLISTRDLPRHATAGENTGADICIHKYAVISSQSSCNQFGIETCLLQTNCTWDIDGFPLNTCIAGN